MSCHVMSYHIISYHIISCHIMYISCHIHTPIFRLWEFAWIKTPKSWLFHVTPSVDWTWSLGNGQELWNILSWPDWPNSSAPTHTEFCVELSEEWPGPNRSGLQFRSREAATHQLHQEDHSPCQIIDDHRETFPALITTFPKISTWSTEISNATGLHVLLDIWQDHLKEAQKRKVPEKISLLLVEGRKSWILGSPRVKWRGRHSVHPGYLHQVLKEALLQLSSE